MCRKVRCGRSRGLNSNGVPARGNETSARSVDDGRRRSGTFLLHLIKPSHYDDDGYVIQWWRGSIPSNSLSSLYGLAAQARAEGVLGPDVRIDIEVRDESTEILPLRRIIRQFQRTGLNGLVCLVGVQTNQFPRAMDIARELRRAGIQVAIGGFHVSGCLAMLPELPADLREAEQLGICLFAGEAEGRLEALLRAAHERRLPPRYDFMKDLPGLEAQPLPSLPADNVRRYIGHIGTFDAGRGCPFTCSFCTIINVQGRKSRHRTPDDIEGLIRAGARQGITSFFITDDNFARNRNWEAILDRIIALRAEGMKIHLNMQVDTMCHRIPRFIAKAARAGCTKVFIGLENINPANLREASKGQNQITEYRAMLQAWRRARVLTFAGYILGFPHDTAESVANDIAVIQRELPIDILEFFVLTPLPGSRDHQELAKRGVAMDADMNRYDSEHVVTAHPNMTRAEWAAVYADAWRRYYSMAHIETLIRRANTGGARPRRVAEAAFMFRATALHEGVHPLQGGIFRRKSRRQRRSGLPRENVFVFTWRRVREVATTYLPVLLLLWRIDRLRRRIVRANEPYSDPAIARDDGVEDLELYRTSEAARAAADGARRRLAARAVAAEPG